MVKQILCHGYEFNQNYVALFCKKQRKDGTLKNIVATLSQDRTTLSYPEYRYGLTFEKGLEDLRKLFRPKNFHKNPEARLEATRKVKELLAVPA